MENKLTNLFYFWDGPPMPPLCSLGIKSLLKHASGFDVYSLNASNIKEFLPDLDDNWHRLRKWAHKADYIRPRVLSKYGGIFVDVDIVCLEDLNILTDELEKSKATLMADEMSCTNRKWLAVGLLVAKPNCPVLEKYASEQDKYLKNNQFKVDKWHSIGGNLLNECRVAPIHLIKYQRPFPVGETRKGYLSRKHWSRFIRKTRGIPKPVIWPLCYSSHLKKEKSILDKTEQEWLDGNLMISSAFRYALRLGSEPRILV